LGSNHTASEVPPVHDSLPDSPVPINILFHTTHKIVVQWCRELEPDLHPKRLLRNSVLPGSLTPERQPQLHENSINGKAENSGSSSNQCEWLPELIDMDDMETAQVKRDEF